MAKNNITIYTDETAKRNSKFEKLCMKTQSQMKNYVTCRLTSEAKARGKVVVSDGYVYYEGTFPVLLCAHMDTVHKETPKIFVYANGTISSPHGIGGDDRCGIYMIFEILKKYDCHVVFLEDEEIGCVGARKFAASKLIKRIKKNAGLKYIIEFDRKNGTDAVTYDCENQEFDDFICKEYFKKNWGTCSDISYIAPELDIAAVNLSCGYYHEHHLDHYVDLEEMYAVIENAKKILERTTDEVKSFKYIAKKSYGYGYYGKRGGYYDDGWYDDDYYYGSRYSSGVKSTYSTSTPANTNAYNDKGYSGNYDLGYDDDAWFKIKYRENGTDKYAYAQGWCEGEAFLHFCKDHPNICWNDVVDIEEF